jgi:chromate transporter
MAFVAIKTPNQAAVATITLTGPAAILCYSIVRMTNTHRDKKWHRALREGLAPVGIGLTIAGSITIFQLSGGGILAASIASLSAGIMLFYPNVPVLLLLLLAGIVNASIYLTG